MPPGREKEEEKEITPKPAILLFLRPLGERKKGMREPPVKTYGCHIFHSLFLSNPKNEK